MNADSKFELDKLDFSHQTVSRFADLKLLWLKFTPIKKVPDKSALEKSICDKSNSSKLANLKFSFRIEIFRNNEQNSGLLLSLTGEASLKKLFTIFQVFINVQINSLSENLEKYLICNRKLNKFLI